MHLSSEAKKGCTCTCQLNKRREDGHTYTLTKQRRTRRAFACCPHRGEEVELRVEGAAHAPCWISNGRLNKLQEEQRPECPLFKPRVPQCCLSPHVEKHRASGGRKRLITNSTVCLAGLDVLVGVCVSHIEPAPHGRRAEATHSWYCDRIIESANVARKVNHDEKAAVRRGGNA